MKEKINSIFDDESLDNEAKREALVESLKDFVPKGRLTEYADKLKQVEKERDDANAELKTIKDANMTAEQKLQAERDKFAKDQTLLAKKINEVDVRSMFASAGLEQAKIDELVEKIVSEDGDKSKLLAQSFIDTFNEIKESTKKTTTTELLKNTPAPVVNNSNKPEITKEDFTKMTYGEKKQLFAENPETFKKLSNE
jgi:hypothetical protein